MQWWAALMCRLKRHQTQFTGGKSQIKRFKDGSVKESEIKMDRYHRAIQTLEFDIDPIVSTGTIGISNRYRKIDQSDLFPTFAYML